MVVKSTGVVVKNIPTIEQCLNGMQWSPADNELALFILLLGEVYDFYGGSNIIDGLMTLDKYGIDWAASNTPKNETWTTWDSFGEGESNAVLEVEFTTLDKSWQRFTWETLKFGVDMPNISDVIKACSGFFLRSLEND